MVGIGPGGPLDRTRRAEEAIAASDCVVGYTRYMELVSDITAGKELIATGMTRETERCRIALARATEGKTVSLISSGDPGIYGMAGLVLELAAAEGNSIPIEIIPGVTAAQALAARLGAPLMCDYATLSLSDLLVPWETIRAAAGGRCGRRSGRGALQPPVAKAHPPARRGGGHLPPPPPRNDPGGDRDGDWFTG